MKWAILAFLALNMTLAVVQWVPLSSAEGAPTLAKAVPGEPIKTVDVIRISAAAGERIASLTVPAPVAEAAPRPMRCYWAGPFPKLDLAIAVQTALEQDGYKVAPEERRHEVEGGYLVYIPPARSSALARLLEDELRSKGVGDSTVIKSGELRNAVAIGLFREPSLAEKRQEEVRQLGFEPALKHRTEEEIEVWLRVAGDPDSQPPSLASNGAATVTVAETACS